MNLDYITDQVLFKMEDWEKQRIRPAFVIIGRKEYGDIMKDAYEHPVMNIGKNQGMMILDMPVIVDFESGSRVTELWRWGLLMIEKEKRRGGKINEKYNY